MTLGRPGQWQRVTLSTTATPELLKNTQPLLASAPLILKEASSKSLEEHSQASPNKSILTPWLPEHLSPSSALCSGSCAFHLVSYSYHARSHLEGQASSLSGPAQMSLQEGLPCQSAPCFHPHILPTPFPSTHTAPGSVVTYDLGLAVISAHVLFPLCSWVVLHSHWFLSRGKS